MKILKTCCNFKNNKGFIDFDILQLIFTGVIIAITIWAGLEIYKLYKEDRLIQTAIEEVDELSRFYAKQFPEQKEKINFSAEKIKKVLKNNGTKIVECLKKEDPIICVKAVGMGNQIPLNNKEELMKAINTIENLKNKLK